MLTLTPVHLALLTSGGPLVMVNLLTITPVGGPVLRYGNAPVPLVYGSEVYAPLSFEVGESNMPLGLQVDDLTVTINPRIYPVSALSEAEQDLLLGLPWIKAVRQGALFEAILSFDTGDIDPLTGPDIVGLRNEFTGQIAEPSFDDGLKLVVKSPLEILNRSLPGQIFQPGCPYRLYDARCGLNKASWAVEAIAAAGSTPTLINCNLTQAAGWFNLGSVEFTSGVNAGQVRTVQSSAPGWLTVLGPLLAAPAAGDAFIAWPGCDRRSATCDEKFNNWITIDGLEVLRFGGQPLIPEPETALG